MKPWPRRVPLFSKPKASCDFIRSERIVGLTEPGKSGRVVFPVLDGASPKINKQALAAANAAITKSQAG